MSSNVKWDVNKYREEHECTEHWLLRKAFLERWKDNYPEDRLLCLARVFTNIEFLGCRYPAEVMKEVATLSEEVAKTYRDRKRTKLQRTFVSASTAAQDRAKGIKRKGGIMETETQPKSSRINFVKQGHTNTDTVVLGSDNDSDDETEVQISAPHTQDAEKSENEMKTSSSMNPYEYLNELLSLECMDIRSFKDNMFYTRFGKLVLLVRPWANRLTNITASFQACRIPLQITYDKGCFTIMSKGIILAQGRGDSKPEAKAAVEELAWNTLKTQVISVLIKEQWIAQGSAPISVSDVTGDSRQPPDTFGTPIESNVASNIMKMMGWKGGGLGADSQGIAEPIKPHFQMVNRAGLGSTASDIRQVKKAAYNLMERFIASGSLDVDLVFSSDFNKEERAALHMCAQKSGLASKSYGKDANRFLVVKKKLNPFLIVTGVLEEGGNTPKYQLFLPIALSNNNF